MSGRGPITLFGCTECGTVRLSIGKLHAHIDAKHRGWGPFNILPPIRPGPGHYPSLMAYTQVLEVEDYEVAFDGQIDDYETRLNSLKTNRGEAGE